MKRRDAKQSFTRTFQSKTLKTGQTTDRSPAGYSAKDDGNLQVGYAKSYTVNTTGQYSGTTNVTVNGKTDVKSNNTVTDDNTGLMWTRYPSASVGSASDGRLKWDDTGGSNEDVFAYCDAANTASLSGHTDWRVPNIREMMTLPNMEVADAQPDGTAFPSGFNANAWSSTTAPTDITMAMKYSPSNGIFNASTGNKTNGSNFWVMLVRG